MLAAVGVSLEDEREGDTEDGERLGEGEAKEGDRLQHAAGLGLTGDAVDVGGEDQTDTDTGADGGEAVTEDGDVASHVDPFLLVVSAAVQRAGSKLVWRSCGGAVAGGCRRWGSVLVGDGTGDVGAVEQGEE